MKLYDSAMAPNPRRVRIFLAEKGVEVDTVQIDIGDYDSYLAGIKSTGSVYFFGALDPTWGDPAALLAALTQRTDGGLRLGVAQCRIWEECQPDIALRLGEALRELGGSGWRVAEKDGGLLDEAGHLYMRSGMAGAECRDFLDRDLPGWLERLHPLVGSRLAGVPSRSSEAYAEAVQERERLMALAPLLFGDCDVLALPTAVLTPPPVEELEPMERYLEVNAATLRPTCPVSMLGLCAVTVPVGLDRAGMPVGLQLVARGGADEMALAAALAAERVLGEPLRRLGAAPALRATSG